MFDLADFGGDPALLDNSQALRDAMTALSNAGGGVLNIDGGTYRLASASLTTPIAVPSNVHIRGAGPAATNLLVTGTTQTAAIFDFTGQQNVMITDLGLTGNGKSTGDNNGAALWCYGRASTTRDVRNFHLSRLKLENFMAPYWIVFAYDQPSAFSMGDIYVEDVEAISRVGNSFAPGDVRVHAHALMVSGYAGPVDNVRVRNLHVEATHMKGGVFLFNQVVDAVLENVEVLNAGLQGATNNAAAYAIALYDSDSRGLRRITVLNPILIKPRSCGIYVAAGSDVAIVNANVTDQFDTSIGELPKGAVVFNGTVRFSMLAGLCQRNYQDVSINPGSARIDGLIDGLQSRDAVRSIFVSYAPPVPAGAGLRITNVDLRSSITNSTGIAVQNSATYVVNDVQIVGCSVQADLYGIDLYVDSGSAAKGYLIANTVARASSRPIRAINMTESLEIQDAQLFTGTGGVCLQLTNCKEIVLVNVNAHDATGAGYGFHLNGTTTGSTRQLTARNCTTFGIGLGENPPSFTGSTGDTVQNLAPAELGVSGAKYVLREWLCLGAAMWVGQRQPTGN
jgi:hypothetical protein